MRIKSCLTGLALAATACPIGVAAEDTAPVITKFEFADKAYTGALSDNGKWALAMGTSYANATPKLVNVLTGDWTELDEAQAGYSATDVTDDGEIVVGQGNGLPAYWSKSTGTWTQLPIDKTKWEGGGILTVSSDGHWAAGWQYAEDGYQAAAVLWDLTTGTIVETPNLPVTDMANEQKDQAKFTEISADGRYLLGTLSFSYLPSFNYAGGCCVFIYDRQTDAYKMIGFDENGSGDWTPHAEGLILVENGIMEPNGHYVAGNATILDSNGSNYTIPYIYDNYTDEFKLCSDPIVKESLCSGVTTQGTLIISTPATNPIREWYVNHGNYWFAFSQILKQKYNIDFYSKTNYDNTGTVTGVSVDGKVVACFPDPYCGYAAVLPVSLDNICEGIQLLGAFSCNPAAGASVSKLTNVSVTFGYSIQRLGSASSIKLQDEAGQNVVSAFGANVDGKTMKIIFRNASLEPGKNYSLYIPAGTICIAGDETQKNADIRIPYTGRADTSVAMTEVIPADNSAIAKIDYNTNPVIVTFDADVKISDTAKASLYANEDTEPLCDLLLAVSGNRIAIYPATTQYLFEGSSYRIVLSAGSVTDLAGNGGNAELTVNYRGSYIREISPDDIYLFKDDFSDGLINFMVYDGDQHQPVSEMVAWEFTPSMGWHFVRDDDGNDPAACSHSMYTPAGQSDDWMVTPQIYIPDGLCKLNFDSQSYLNSKQDHLKVYVWESNNSYNTMNAETIARIKAEGTVIYDKVQTPGATEGVLAGEWTSNTVNLHEYAGKNIYIAFVNDNNDQSAVFVDNVEIRHDMNFLLSLSTPASVVAKNDVVISGAVTGNNSEKNYTTLELTLRDGNGNVVDTYRADGLNLAKGQSHNFTFSKPLPLTAGQENKYTINIQCDDETNNVSASVKALLFQPVKRVVLEEFTGRDCPNCPLGLISIDLMEQRFGDKFIPVSIHTYSSDPLGAGLYDYTSYLKLAAAPSGVINRSNVASPAFTANNDYHFTNTEVDAEVDPTWLDLAEAALAIPSEAEIKVTPTYEDGDQTSISVDCDIRFALNATDQNIGLFAVLIQDNITGYQQNNLGGVDNPKLGEYGKGGKYEAGYIYPFTHNDVARAYYGSFNGTVGKIPQNLVAGEIYSPQLTLSVPEDVVGSLNDCKVMVMMIDSNNGSVINAAIGDVIDSAGVDSVLAGNETAISVTCADGFVRVSGDGHLSANIYSTSGQLIGTADGENSIIINVSANTGIAVVKATGANSTVAKKIIIR